MKTREAYTSLVFFILKQQVSLPASPLSAKASGTSLTDEQSRATPGLEAVKATYTEYKTNSISNFVYN